MPSSRLLLLCWLSVAAFALEKPGVVYKVFQFPPDQIPRIDGKTEDWDIVPAGYAVGFDQLTDSHGRVKPDPKDLDARVRVGWVKGLNRLYFLYEASDNYWDFSRNDLHNDMFELIVEGPQGKSRRAKVWDVVLK